jgi:site-specific DNA recombinase
MTSAAIYARVSSARQKKDQTIGSQTQALREHAAQNRLEVPEAWVFEDEGHSGATLVRPGLEALRDLAAQGCVDVVLCYSPDRLARKFAYQALLIEEFTRSGVRVEFVKGPRGDTPEDQLMVQFQGMFAEYEKAQLAERYRRGKAYRARAGSVNVLGGAPFGYRYLRKNEHSGAVYEIAEHEAALVTEMFRRYADDGASIADLARWLTSQGVLTRTGKTRWDRSVIWGMLRNPAYAGTAVFGKTRVVAESPGLNRVARLQGRSVPRASRTVDRPREEWTGIPVPAIISTQTFDRVQQRLADNKRYAARNTRVPSLLQGLAACQACGYGYYRTSTRTTNKKIYYYRCLGSDDYRYEGGRVCRNQPVRADYLDTVVWDHITGLLADPALIRNEISKRLEQARTSDPVTRQRHRLEADQAKAATAITAMIEAYSEQLITIDELRTRLPHLRAREANLRGQIDAIDTQSADRDAYLQLADNLESFLAQLNSTAATASTPDRQRVLRLLVKDVLVGPEKITIRHRIPARGNSSATRHHDDDTDTEGDSAPSYPLRWGRDHPALRGPGDRPLKTRLRHHPCLQPQADQLEHPPVAHPLGHLSQQPLMADLAEEVADVELRDELAARDEPGAKPLHRLRRRPLRPEPVRARMEVRLENRFQHNLRGGLSHPVTDRRDTQRPLAVIGFGDVHAPGRRGTVGACAQVLLESGEQPLDPVLLPHVRQGDPIHPGRAPVLAHAVPRLPQDVTPVNTVIQSVEPALLRLLGRSP